MLSLPMIQFEVCYPSERRNKIMGAQRSHLLLSFLIFLGSQHIAQSENAEIFPKDTLVAIGETVTLTYASSDIANDTTCEFIPPVNTAQPLNCSESNPKTLFFEMSRASPMTLECIWGNYSCGLRIFNINQKLAGEWKLNLLSNNGSLIRNTQRTIQVKSSSYVSLDSDVHLAGQNNKITIKVWDDDGLYCRIRLQNGTEVIRQVVENQCTVDIGASDAVPGEYTIDAFVGLSTKTEEVSTILDWIDFYDDPVEIEVDNSGKDLTILCTLRKRAQLKYCRFEHPNGTAYNMVDGVGTTGIRQYGSGLENGQCGITRLNYSTNELGRWKCALYENEEYYEKEEYIAYPMVKAATGKKAAVLSDEQLKPDENTKGFVVGENVTMLCTTLSPLQYCRFSDNLDNDFLVIPEEYVQVTKPNGTIYTYYGAGLRNGECGVTIINATEENQGDWKCHVGLVGKSKELSANISVRVLGLTSEYSGIDSKKQAVVQCKPSVPKTPRHCRLIKPDGTGINVAKAASDDTHTFNLDMKTGNCSLVISKPDDTDYGQWKCEILLHEKNMELRTDIDLPRSGSQRTGGISVGILAVLGILVAFVH